MEQNSEEPTHNLTADSFLVGLLSPKERMQFLLSNLKEGE